MSVSLTQCKPIRFGLNIHVKTHYLASTRYSTKMIKKRNPVTSLQAHTAERESGGHTGNKEMKLKEKALPGPFVRSQGSEMEVCLMVDDLLCHLDPLSESVDRVYQ